MAPAGEHERLTERAYWDEQYAAQPTTPPPPHQRSRFKEYLKKLFGPGLVERMRDYREFVLWDVLYARHLATTRGAKALEVGSAPGAHLVQLAKAFGVDPYGVEYTEHGVLVNRAEFQREGFNPDHVIQADFFSAEFQREYAGVFDLVVSRGFIEHFTDVSSVIAAHVRMLAPGGLLVVTIPNLRGVNLALQWWFHRAVIPLHNRAIMHLETFAHLFDLAGLTPLLCRYYGTFNFGVFAVDRESRLRRWSFWCCWQVQRVLNVALRTFFNSRGADSAAASPYLIFIGRKSV